MGNNKQERKKSNPVSQVTFIHQVKLFGKGKFMFQGYKDAERVYLIIP